MPLQVASCKLADPLGIVPGVGLKLSAGCGIAATTGRWQATWVDDRFFFKGSGLTSFGGFEYETRAQVNEGYLRKPLHFTKQASLAFTPEGLIDLQIRFRLH